MGRSAVGFESCRDHHLNWRVGRAVRQRGANASSPSGRTGSIPVLSAIARTWSVIPSRSIGSCKTDSAGRTLQRRLPGPLRLFHSCGRGVVGCVPVFQTGGVRFDPGRPRQPAIAWCQGYGAFNAGLRGLNSRWQDQIRDQILGRVAKLAKAPDFDSGHRKFESCRACQFFAGPRQGRGRPS
jgi:hypothetical protein